MPEHQFFKLFTFPNKTMKFQSFPFMISKICYKRKKCSQEREKLSLKGKFEKQFRRIEANRFNKAISDFLLLGDDNDFQRSFKTGL